MNSLTQHASPRLVALATLVVIGIFGLSLLWRRPPARTEPAPAEMPRTDLVQRDGQWWLRDPSIPFTGMLVDFYESGVRKSRSTVVDGRLEGLSEGWHPDGQRQVVEHFRSGISHGQRTKWHPNGRLLSEADIMDGRIEGVFRRWHENGILAEEMEMKRGVAHGFSRAYHASGCLKAEVRLNSGNVVEQRFWKDGEVPPHLVAANIPRSTKTAPGP
ncbi:MAG: toxin-antitoxin system YwqK family antitoxin [Verrucomicrobiales bacterium]|nr:toxin-antitoxin system YwqK family antitoxin [Verrucomicrobiales bacterium]